MKWMFPFLLITACVSSTVLAQPIFIDVSAATTQSANKGTGLELGGDTDTFTSIFQQLGLYAQSTTTQYDTDASGTLNLGDRFLDIGTAALTDLLPPLGDDEGLGFLSEITVLWRGLSGATASNLTAVGSNYTQNIVYDEKNTVFEFFFHGDTGDIDGAPDADFGTSISAVDNTGFNNGEKVLEIAITGGAGFNTFDANLSFISGSSILNGEIIYALNNFWWFDNGDNTPGTTGDRNFEDLLGLAVPIVLHSKIDQNTDEIFIDTTIAGTPGPEGFGKALFSVSSSHDGSINFHVPEPGTLFLLGIGLVLLPGIRWSLFQQKTV